MVAATASSSFSDLPAVARSFHSASAEMLAAILDQSLDCIKVLDPAGKLDFMNRNGLCAMEIDDVAAVVGRNWWDLWPEESRALIRDAVERARAGRAHRFEAFCPTAKGTPRWWEVSVSPLQDEHGTTQGIISVSRDISERVQAQELRETVAAEMRHRLLNAYTLAGAIISSTARASPENAAFAEEVLERLAKLSITQSLLLQAGELRDISVQTLLHQLTEPFHGGTCQFHLRSLPDVALREEGARVLALVIGELSTNSNKHGALRRGGAIEISGTLEADVLRLQWTERAEGAAAPLRTGTGQGHRLIDRALRSQRGDLRIEWLETGLHVTFSLPVAQAA